MADSNIRDVIRYWKTSGDFSAVSDEDLLWLIRALHAEDRNRHTALVHHPSIGFACGQNYNSIVCHRMTKPSANLELVYHIDENEQLVPGLGLAGVWNPRLHYVWLPEILQREPQFSRARYDVLNCPQYPKLNDQRLILQPMPSCNDQQSRRTK